MSERPSPARVAVVLGGSHTGVLAARALAGFAERVIVVERDRLPDGPEPRRGLPQARHVHLLWSGGVHAMERLLPGVVAALREAGARRAPITTDMVALSPQGWFRRWPESHHILLAGRDLLDATVRRLVLADGRIEVRDRTEAVSLMGDAGAVTGVRLRGPDGKVTEVRAGFVVDATGRGSAAARRLADLGVPAPEHREVDAGLAYASRLFLAPEGARDGFPVVNVQADPHGDGPGRAGVLLPIENGRWLVTLSGTRGGEPGAGEEDFLRFAREELRHPVIADLLRHAEPLTDVSFTRSTANRRHYYERLRVWPENVVVLGDALAAFNPVYGHGLAVGAQCALALRDTVRRLGWGAPGLARQAQRAMARPVSAAWDLAIGQDVFYPGATDTGPTLRDRLVAGYVARLMRTATGNGRIARRVTDVTSLEKGAEVLLAPSVLLAAAVGPLRPPLAGPPLTPDEWKKAGLR